VVRIGNLRSLNWGYVSIGLLTSVDLVLKFLAKQHLEFGQVVEFIPLVDLLLVYNSGIAFSMLDFNNNFTAYGLTVFGVVLVFFLNQMYRNETKLIKRISMILIISGALGNIIDRVIDGVVTDFLFFHIGDLSFFIFNGADAFISIGAALFLLGEVQDHLSKKVL